MKRIVLWIFVLQFATGHNLLAEVLRMPMLLDHYQIHRQETPDLSFANFLWLHYCNTHHEQSDTRHASLPLHCTHGVMAETTLPQPPRIHCICDTKSEPAQSDLCVSDEFLRLTTTLSGVFRPPIA